MLSGNILRLSARRHPRKVALICDDRQMTYGEADSASNRFANAMLSLGLGKGERVAVMCPNIPDYAVIHFGAARTGCQLVHLSIMYGPDELTHILNATRARLLIVEAESQAAIAAVRDRLTHLEHVVVIGTPKQLTAPTLEDFIAAQPDTAPEIGIADTDPLGMTFTGGTTGLPKGAVVSHKARYVSAYTVIIEHELTGDDVVAAVTPLFHAVGLLIWFQAAMLAGCTCVLLRRWDAKAFVAAVGRHKVTAVMTVPVQLRGVLDPANFNAKKLASLVKIGCGGATVTADLIAETRARMPWVRIVDHYGQSETGPLTMLKPWDPADKDDTIGRPAVGVDLKVVSPDGTPVAPGEIGEIVVAGDFMFDGYFENPEDTAAYFRGGDRWGWTGDLATVDTDGYIALAGRSKDMIISGGINVYPREVEIVLEDHDAVAECTVFGIPDDAWGESLVAYVVTRDGADIDDGALIEYCGSRLAHYKRPKVVRFVESIPKTPAGKIQKPRLRDAYLADNPPD